MLLRKHATKILLLNSFGHFQQRLGFKVYGFVVMDNHAHWLLQVQEKIGLSSVMQKVLLSFGRRYRQTQPYVGHFWQGRYKSVGVVSDKGMLEVLKYVHENPVKAKVVRRSQEYMYSSAYKYLGIDNEAMRSVIEVTKYGDTSAGSVELIKL